MANEVEITVTSKDQSAQGMGSARQGADDLGNSTRRVGDIAKGIIAAGLFERIASGARRAFTSTKDAASNLNESVNAVNVVFGESADRVHALGATADQSMGLSQRAFNESAVQFSNFAKVIATDGRSTADVVAEMTQRASDFASVHNLDVADSLQLFQSGLAGETEPLRRYGILLSEAEVKAFAYANGIAEAGQELTEQQKVLARYGSIMQQTSNTQGDFANTSGDVANATRIAQAELENAQASMGQNLLPVLATGAQLLTNLLVGFQALPGPVQATVGAVTGLTAALAAAQLAARALGISLSTVAKNPLVIGATVILGAATAALSAFGAASSDSSQQQAELKSTLDETTGAITGQTRAAVAARLEQEGLLGKARELGIDLETLTEAYLGNEQAIARVRSRTGQLIEENTRWIHTGNSSREQVVGLGRDAQKLNEDLGEQVESLGSAQQGFRQVAEATAEAGGAQRDFDGEIDDVNEQIDQQRDKLDELLDKLFEVEDQLLNTRDAERNLESAIDAAAEAVAENGETLDRNTEEGRANESALDDIAAAAHKLAQQQAETGASGDEMRSSMERARKKFLETADAMGLEEEQAKDLADELGLIPSEVETTAKLRDETKAAREELERQLANLTRSREIQVRITQTGRVIGAGGSLAHGGNTGATEFDGTAQAGGPRGGSRVLVGEHRPEVVELPFGSRVIPSVDQALGPVPSATDRRSDRDGRVIVVENLHVTAVDDQFRMSQLMEQLETLLEFRGAA